MADLIVMGMDVSAVGTGLATVRVPEKLPPVLYPEATDLFDKGSKTRYKAKAIQGIENLEYVTEGIAAALQRDMPTLVVLEDYAGGGGPNPFNMALAAEVTGQAKLLMRRFKIPWIEVGASTLKKFTTGKGNTPKDLMREFAYRRWGVGVEHLEDNNVVDAYCLSRYGVALLLSREGRYEPLNYESAALAVHRIGGAPRESKGKRKRK